MLFLNGLMSHLGHRMPPDLFSITAFPTQSFAFLSPSLISERTLPVPAENGTDMPLSVSRKRREATSERTRGGGRPGILFTCTDVLHGSYLVVQTKFREYITASPLQPDHPARTQHPVRTPNMFNTADRSQKT
jgi:hypothetical protein